MLIADMAIFENLWSKSLWEHDVYVLPVIGSDTAIEVGRLDWLLQSVAWDFIHAPRMRKADSHVGSERVMV